MIDATSRISQEVAWAMRAAIDESDGAEVLFVCDTDSDMLVTAARVVARGAPEMVAAPMDHIRRGQIAIHNHPSGVLQPSAADVSVAAELADSGVGSYIVNNDVTELIVVCEPFEPEHLEPLDIEGLVALIDSGGALSDLMPDFEPRASQIAMLEKVAAAFNDDELIAVEAGTGVGKSFAYLLPAIAWAATNNERVVVSTATINLQQQLVDKDIPSVQKLLGVDVPVMLVKGRGNYLCRKRLGEMHEESSLFEEEADDPDLAALRDWAEVTDTGSRSEVPFPVPEELWSAVNSDPDSCTELRCRLREDCFFLKARREATAAKVLVANHHLLFIDLALRVRGIGFDTRAILPPFQRLIFDEAHSIENSATSLFSESFSRFAVQKHSRRLRHTRRNRALGLLPSVRRRGANPEYVVRATEELSKVDEAAEALNAAVLAATASQTFRLTPELPAGTKDAILEPVAELHKRLVLLANTLKDVLEDDDGEEAGPFYDLRVTLRRIENLIGVCDSFGDFQNHSDRVFWIEVRRSGAGQSYARLISSPLDIRQVMREAVYDVFPTAVFTSATLTVAGSFDYWSGRIGLGDADRPAQQLSLPSPFPYEEHALVAVPTDAPEPSAPAYSEYLRSFLEDLLLTSEGHALVLFTSYEMLRALHGALRETLAEHGIAALRQGDDDRARLLRNFALDKTSVLFATESFWQGVDVPGESLQVVVLCRLPFRVPTDPILVARTEAIERRGGNAFAELSLPEAVMKFRQGFGRLMRRGTDRGVVVVTDVRVFTKRYGGAFLESLPETQSSRREGAGVIEDVERFLYP